MQNRWGVLALLFAVRTTMAVVAGWIATAVGTSRTTFDFGAAMLLLCCAAYWLFSRLSERVKAETGMGLAVTPRSSPP